MRSLPPGRRVVQQVPPRVAACILPALSHNGIMPIPVAAWARTYGLARDPGSERRAISLTGPGPDFSPQYAMTTDPGEPAVLATLAGASGELTPLLIGGYARPIIAR